MWPSFRILIAVLLICLAIPASAAESALPSLYYQWMREGSERVRARLDQEPGASLRQLESRDGWTHFPHAILAPAVLFTNQHEANSHHADKRMLDLAIRIGDLLAFEDENGAYKDRLDSYWDTYMWLEAYRLLEPHLDESRKSRWKAALTRNVAMVAPDCLAWRDAPRYNSFYLGTSTNHFALWALNLYLGGKHLARPEWEKLGADILHRLAAKEQSVDGFWGESTPDGPTNGYNTLTLAAVAAYYAHSHDEAARVALLRATTFHTHFTWPNAQPIELLNDRNRHWGAKIYGNFGFTLTPEGRALAKLIADSYQPEDLTIETIGRVAQNALYFHDGPTPAPLQRQTDYSLQLQTTAGVRKKGAWLWSLAGIPSAKRPYSQWFLDRQSTVSVYHDRLGLIISGANSKNQPELASFREIINGVTDYLPADATLRMSDEGDILSLAYQRFYVTIEPKRISDKEMELRYRITGMGPIPDSAMLTLQLVVTTEQELRTKQTTGRLSSRAELRLANAQIGGSISHNGWTIHSENEMTLQWPVYPFNPYRNGRSNRIEDAVATLNFPIALKPVKRPYVRPNEQEIVIRLRAD